MVKSIQMASLVAAALLLSTGYGLNEAQVEDGLQPNNASKGGNPEAATRFPNANDTDVNAIIDNGNDAGGTAPSNPSTPSQPSNPTQPPSTTQPEKISGKFTFGAPVRQLIRDTNQIFWGAQMAVRPTDGAVYVYASMGSAVGPSGMAGDAVTRRVDAASPWTLVASTKNRPIQGMNFAFANDGSALFSYREDNGGYSGFARRMDPNGAIGAIVPFGSQYTAANGGGSFDIAHVTYVAPENQFYMMGQSIPANTPGRLAMATIPLTGTTISSTKVLTGNRPTGDEMHTRTCSDPQGNIHTVTTWEFFRLYAVDRINGVWTQGTVLSEPNVNYRGDLSIACAADGRAYVIAPGSTGITFARYTPGVGWQRLSSSLFPAYTYIAETDMTTTPDGHLLVTFGSSEATIRGVQFTVSSDFGATFSPVQAIIPHNGGAMSPAVAYSPKLKKVFVWGSFRNDAGAESFMVEAPAVPQ